MKYTTKVDIELSREKVIELFDNADNMEKWMEGLQSFEPISGTPGQPGAKSKLKFKMGKRDMEMTETILVRNFPEEFTCSYEVDGVYNVVRNKFEELSENKTRYTTENDFQFKSFAMKVMGFLMPGAFKKQSTKYLKAFKDFAESQA